MRGFRRKLSIFGKKSGGTPNPQVKIVGRTLNADQIFVSAAAFTENVEFSSRLAPAPGTPPSKIGNFKKSEKKNKIGLSTIVFLIKINLTSLLRCFDKIFA